MHSHHRPALKVDGFWWGRGNMSEYRRAIEHVEQHLRIAREIGDRQGEGNALWNISLALDKIRKRGKAIEHAQAALKIYEQIEDR